MLGEPTPAGGASVGAFAAAMAGAPAAGAVATGPAAASANPTSVLFAAPAERG
jgi:hypothetical protein